ncbi:shikimate kinase [Geoanaerobacter pelophilus]|uniref:Shikimate kinase n=1 Tax=Geoanaerobacter pelophilus TaxID=60036 RepID=A0ABQ0MM24_9BACT|nr:shikimate kinase [Geoanaerobacter pelophilus]GAW68122.1 shikimate kinase [Geoanaerobacter pelophilus]
MQAMALIGMPGSGKSAVGRIVAERLGWDFLDTDRLIEQRFGLKLQAVIEQVGAEAFGLIEEQTVLSLEAAQRTVIATGGSVVYSEAAMLHLRSIAAVVFLDLPVDAIRSHIALEAPRGIVGMDQGGLEELYAQRFPLYRKYAQMVVLLDSCTPEEAAARVLSQWQEYHAADGHR